MLDATPIEKSMSISQPKPLYLLFFTELWERFGFYTVQTILILYMTKALMMQDAEANLLYAAFGSFLYITPLLGGYLADNYLGFQRSVIIGGVLFILAYLFCAAEGKTLFFLGLSLLICANGFFKPSVSALVGELYQPNDPRRDGGFTLFYMGINIGALIPPLIAGGLVVKYGWHSGFLLAALGMALGQAIFLMGRKHLGTSGLAPKKQLGSFQLSYSFYGLLFIGIVASVLLLKVAFAYPKAANYLVELSTAMVFVVVLYFLLKESSVDRKKMIVALILILISVGFWSLYNQTFTSLMLFADRNMEHQFLGFKLDAEATQFFNPFFIILFSPLLSRLWIRMDQAGISPGTQLKFALGVLFLCAGFLILGVGTHFFANDYMTPASWLCLSYLLQTIGELLISPIGLAMITVLCPKHLVGMMMGVWFFSQAASFAIGGLLANLAAAPEKTTSAAVSLDLFSHAFTLYGLISLGLALLAFALLPLLNRMTK